MKIANLITTPIKNFISDLTFLDYLGMGVLTLGAFCGFVSAENSKSLKLNVHNLSGSSMYLSRLALLMMPLAITLTTLALTKNITGLYHWYQDNFNQQHHSSHLNRVSEMLVERYRSNQAKLSVTHTMGMLLMLYLIVTSTPFLSDDVREELNINAEMQSRMNFASGFSSLLMCAAFGALETLLTILATGVEKTYQHTAAFFKPLHDDNQGITGSPQAQTNVRQKYGL